VSTALASTTVEIRELDEAALADDEVMRDYYDVSRRAELLGREDSPFWSWGSSSGPTAPVTAASGSRSSRPTTATG
jgi:hypothetical protein